MRRFWSTAFVGAGLVAAGAICTVALSAQGDAGEDAKIWAGVYSADQAQRGQKIYEALCTRCHALDLMGGRGAGGGPALKDTNFWVVWERQPVASILSKIQRTMPADSPGSLRDDDYTDVLSFILAQNKFPAGKSDLTPTVASATRITRPAGTASEVPNFALVQVVGCLTQTDRGWSLTRATIPQVTREESPSSAAVKDAADRALGASELRLVGAAHFKPEAASGRRVEARGLLNKATDSPTLDLLSLQAVSSDCPR
jgi:mono/diheme cytochrome c family protein